MEKGNFHEEYLNDKTASSEKIIGNTEEERLRNTLEIRLKLSEPFIDVDYSKPGEFSQVFQKEVDGNNHETFLGFKWDDQTLRAMVQAEVYKEYDILRMRRLCELRIQTNNFILSSEVVPYPAEGIYFFDTTGLPDDEKWKYFSGLSNPEVGVISGLPPNTPGGLFLILHELSHFWRRMEASEERKNKLSAARIKMQGEEDLTVEDKAMVMEDERSTNAAIVRELTEILRPFTSPEDLKMLYHSSLYRYTQKFEGK